jgi:hypothetical protein
MFPATELQSTPLTACSDSADSVCTMIVTPSSAVRILGKTQGDRTERKLFVAAILTTFALRMPTDLDLAAWPTLRRNSPLFLFNIAHADSTSPINLSADLYPNIPAVV